MAHRNFGRPGQMQGYGGGGGYGGGMNNYHMGGGGMYQSSGANYDKRSMYSSGSSKMFGHFNYGEDEYYNRPNRDRRDMGHPRGRRGRVSPRRRSRSPPTGHSRNYHDNAPPRREVVPIPVPPRNRFSGKIEAKIPRCLLDLKEASVAHLKLRYNRMYVPSDFFHGDLRWQDVFPMYQPMKLGYHADFHIFHKDVNSVVPFDTTEGDPEDADYTFSAKVMLTASPALSDLYQKTCLMADELDSNNDKVAANRQIHFLVGSRGKNEPMAIGGPWSPSLDGDSPEEDPQVLIKTAIRTCKSLTGVDLSNCTQWFRFLELHYYRPAERHAPELVENSSKPREARVETVVVFVPDVWSCMPSEDAWSDLKKDYIEALDKRINPPVPEPQVELLEVDQVEQVTEATANNSTIETSLTQEDEDEGPGEEPAEGDPTHFSQLDLKALKVADIKRELSLRKINSKGLKAQLSARLQKAIEEESDAEKRQKEMVQAVAKQEDQSVDNKDADDTKEKEEEPVELTEKERRRLERLYRMGDKPAIIVHPSREARGGRFDCHKMSLHALLDYRAEDQKEHTFEVSLFAEQFNEMIQRDCAFNIYKAIVIAPEEGEENAHKVTEDTDDEAEPGSKRRRVESEPSKDGNDSENESELKVRMVQRTVDTQLLFSFAYFDISNNKFIAENDLEDLLQMLGLNLSRSQVRKLVSKVSKKSLVNYRTLTDKRIAEGSEEDIVNLRTEIDDADYLLELAQGNKALFDEAPPPIPPRIIVGTAADKSDLLDKIQKIESIRQSVEVQFSLLKTELEKTRKSYNESRNTEDKLNSELNSIREKLRLERRTINEDRQTNNTYLRLLRFSRDNMHRVINEIEGQFEKEKAEKEREAKKLNIDTPGDPDDDKTKQIKDGQSQNEISGTNGDDKKEWEVLDSV